ncbi:hypothetical protein [Rhizobium rhizosphaerae]|nr:hypothetical protein [Xaviernesmea rhizosphaerae]
MRALAKRLSFACAYFLATAGFAADCSLPLAFNHKTRDGVTPVYGDRTAIAFKAPMAVNTDGAPTSYHPDDPTGGKGLAINTICNGANAKLPDGTVLDWRKCSQLIAAFNQAKDHWTEPGKPKIEFYAVATKASGVPCTISSGPHAGYFVSTTALAADPSKDRCDPAHWLDALTVPFIIYPGAENFTKRGVGVGDLAALYNPTNDTVVYAIVGDRGPRLGLSEGSIAVAKALLKRSDDPKTRRDTYGYAVRNAGVVILPKAAMKPPYTAERIRIAGEAALAAWGGTERLKACTNR